MNGAELRALDAAVTKALAGEVLTDGERLYATANERGDRGRIGETTAWIRPRGGRVTARKVFQHRKGGVRTGEGAVELLTDLADLGHGTVTRKVRKDGVSAAKWQDVPLTVGHPTDPAGQHISANSPGVRHVGRGTNPSGTADGRLVADDGFDVCALRQQNPNLLRRLERGEPIELSTGLFPTKQPALNGAAF